MLVVWLTQLSIALTNFNDNFLHTATFARMHIFRNRAGSDLDREKGATLSNLEPVLNGCGADIALSKVNQTGSLAYKSWPRAMVFNGIRLVGQSGSDSFTSKDPSHPVSFELFADLAYNNYSGPGASMPQVGASSWRWTPFLKIRFSKRSVHRAYGDTLASAIPPYIQFDTKEGVWAQASSEDRLPVADPSQIAVAQWCFTPAQKLARFGGQATAGRRSQGDDSTAEDFTRAKSESMTRDFTPPPGVNLPPGFTPPPGFNTGSLAARNSSGAVGQGGSGLAGFALPVSGPYVPQCRLALQELMEENNQPSSDVTGLLLDFRPTPGTLIFAVGRPFVWTCTVLCSLGIASFGRLGNAAIVLLCSFGASSILELVAGILLCMSGHWRACLLPFAMCIWDAFMIPVFTWGIAGRFLAQRTTFMGLVLLLIFSLNLAVVEQDLDPVELLCDIPIIGLFLLLIGSFGWRVRNKKARLTDSSIQRYQQKFDEEWLRVLGVQEEQNSVASLDSTIMLWRARELRQKDCFHRIRFSPSGTFPHQLRLDLLMKVSEKQRVDDLDQLFNQATMLEAFMQSKVLQLSERSGGLLQASQAETNEGDREGVHSDEESTVRTLPPVNEIVWLSWKQIQATSETLEEARSRIRFTAIKPTERAISKAVVVYGKDCSLVVDLVRERLCFDCVHDLDKCLKAILRDPDLDVRRIKSSMGFQDSGVRTGGFRFVAVNFGIRTTQTRRLFLDQHVVELLLILRPFAQLQTEMDHRQYLTFRNYRSLSETVEQTGFKLLSLVTRRESGDDDSTIVGEGEWSVGDQTASAALVFQDQAEEGNPLKLGTRPRATIGAADGESSTGPSTPSARFRSHASLLAAASVEGRGGHVLSDEQVLPESSHEAAPAGELSQSVDLLKMPSKMRRPIENLCSNAAQQAGGLIDEQGKRMAHAMKSSTPVGAFFTTSPIASAVSFSSCRLWLVAAAALFYTRAIHVAVLHSRGNFFYAKYIKLSALNATTLEPVKPTNLIFNHLNYDCRSGLFVGSTDNETASPVLQVEIPMPAESNGLQIVPGLGFPDGAKLKIGVWLSENNKDWACVLPVSGFSKCEYEWESLATAFSRAPIVTHTITDFAISFLRGSGYLGAAAAGFLRQEIYARVPVVASLPLTAVVVAFFAAIELSDPGRFVGAPVNQKFGSLAGAVSFSYSAVLLGLALCVTFQERYIILLQIVLSFSNLVVVAFHENEFYRTSERLGTAFLGDAFVLVSCAVLSAVTVIYNRESKALIQEDQRMYDSIWDAIKRDSGEKKAIEDLATVVATIHSPDSLPLQTFPKRINESWDTNGWAHRGESLLDQAKQFFNFSPRPSAQRRGSFTSSRNSRSRRTGSTSSGNSQEETFGRSRTGSIGSIGDAAGNNFTLVSSLQQLFSQGEILQHLLLERVKKWSQRCNGRFAVKDRVNQFVTLNEAKARGLDDSDLKWGKLKSVSRALEKQLRSYKGNVARLTDIVRQSLVFDSLKDLVVCLEIIKEDPDVVLHRVKNRYTLRYNSSVTAGYRDLGINVALISRESHLFHLEKHICEVQLILRHFAAVKSDEGHQRYILFRNRTGQ